MKINQELFEGKYQHNGEWKDIAGYEGMYMVNRMGDVKGLTRVLCYGNTKRVEPGCLRKPKTDRYGYLHLSLSRNGKKRWFTVHRLVAGAFIPNPKGLKAVNHKDGDKKNNHFENLEWVTCSQNTQHAYDTGLHSQVGSKNASSKLTEQDVIAIRKLYATGEYKQKELAVKFSTSNGNMCNIINRKVWLHV